MFAPSPPPTSGIISLHRTAWSAAVEDDFRQAFPSNSRDRILRRDPSLPRPPFARAKTIHNASYSLALFEGAISNHFPDRLHMSLREQVDGRSLRGFVAHLQLTNEPHSVVDHLSRLIYLLKRLGLHRHALLGRMERAAIKLPRRHKRRAPFTTRQLWAAGEGLIEEAKRRRRLAPGDRRRPALLRATGELYRDGLLLCFSALCLPRIANTGAMRIGRHLLHRDKVYRLHFPDDEVKTGRSVDAAVPAVLVGHFETYLDVFRPLIRHAGRHDHLWASRFGGGLSLIGLHQVYKRHFRRVLKVDAASHDCRRAAANAVTLDPRAPSGLAELILQHKGARTVNRYVTVKRGNLDGLLSTLTDC